MKKLILLSLIFLSALAHADLRRGDSADVPAGTMLDFAGPNCPVGFLKNDGSTPSRVTYSKLFAAISTTYGVGNGSTTFKLPTYNWFVDANIGGANPSLGITALTSYTTIGDPNLDLILNTAKGSFSAEIPCTAGVASSGFNCGGSSEHIGIVFTPANMGQYEACFAFGHRFIVGANSSLSSTFQVIETANTGGALLQEGGQRVASGLVNNNTAAIAVTNPVSICGVFNFSDTSKKTLRLMYEHQPGGSPISSNIEADRSSTLGQQDVYVTVKPLSYVPKCIKY